MLVARAARDGAARAIGIRAVPPIPLFDLDPEYVMTLTTL